MKDLINARIQDLIAKGRELEQQIHQINGALQQCQWTMSELEKNHAAEEIDKPESV
jgi:prefoldin subunit 5